MMELRERALEALCHDTWQAKAACLKSLSQSTPLDPTRIFLASADIPGRPAIKLVPPAQLGLRSVHTLEGRAILIHALAHIEFNAINLALDVIWRFENMPDKFYYDWLQVAQEECEHFGLLNQHLQTLGHQYGDFSGHDGLWEMAERTQDDVLARLALVPRVQEWVSRSRSVSKCTTCMSACTPASVRPAHTVDTRWAVNLPSAFSSLS
jgi:uncharacterized ferritin-like protein (DUF455 family)